MSSSKLSQWSPRLLMRQASRSFEVARSSRGNQAIGTPRVLPSDSSTHMLSSSNLTATALTEEPSPRLLDALTVRLDQSYAFPQLFFLRAGLVCNRYLARTSWLRPEDDISYRITFNDTS